MMMAECTCFRSPTMAQTAHVADDGLMVWLIYAGAFDAQDGPASQEAWLHDLVWHGRIGFRDAMIALIARKMLSMSCSRAPWVWNAG